MMLVRRRSDIMALLAGDEAFYRAALSAENAPRTLSSSLRDNHSTHYSASSGSP